jgi:hypothetical protein
VLLLADLCHSDILITAEHRVLGDVVSALFFDCKLRLKDRGVEKPPEIVEQTVGMGEETMVFPEEGILLLTLLWW